MVEQLLPMLMLFVVLLWYLSAYSEFIGYVLTNAQTYYC